MFTDLLRALSDGRPHTMGDLADELGTDAGMLRLAFEHCERMGYLERDAAGLSLGCSGACGLCGSRSCDLRDSATDGTSGLLRAGPSWWRVTESGRRAAGVCGEAARV